MPRCNSSQMHRLEACRISISRRRSIRVTLRRPNGTRQSVIRTREARRSKAPPRPTASPFLRLLRMRLAPKRSCGSCFQSRRLINWREQGFCVPRSWPQATEMRFSCRCGGLLWSAPGRDLRSRRSSTHAATQIYIAGSIGLIIQYDAYGGSVGRRWRSAIRRLREALERLALHSCRRGPTSRPGTFFRSCKSLLPDGGCRTPDRD